ncbi:MAG: Rrf2 family transcriptional regulator [Dehalococcoidia bacterium]|nr:Rrf2 family transcriptional regulator [Dehalococcoidia bacterium]
MRVSTRGRYGLRALVDLALHQGPGLVPLRDVARRQEISLAYLEHLIAPLIAGGIVRSRRGTQGGVSLLRDPREIRLSEVVRLLEGSIALVECVNSPEICLRSELCATRHTWLELNRAMNGILEATTLQDLLERQEEKSNTQPVQ